ncbi:apelin receptor B [Elysia marginata]|uniref:Apelin receptor B n=1 Tax=Elysia marginata TaxID=1093978 RepID=A0AAV4ESS9_9GAST|nr:apelin receptor B [Elysia marginata]
MLNVQVQFLLPFSSSDASGNGINHTSHSGERTLGITHRIASGESKATCNQRQRVGAISATFGKLAAALGTTSVYTVTDSATSCVTDGRLGLTQPTKETCQVTGLLGKPTLSATGVCTGRSVGAVDQDGDHG